jgi:hypothetical protein
MASEPLTFAMELSGTDESFNPTPTFGDYAAATGTVLFFFRSSGQAGDGTIFVQNRVPNGARFIIDGTNDRLEFYISDGAIGPVNIAQYRFTPPSTLFDDVYHLVAVMQDGLGNPVWRYDDTEYTIADSEVTEVLSGTGDSTYWFADTLVGVQPADQTYIGAFQPAGDNFDGRFFNILWDNDVWTSADLTTLWETAVANGLNP